MVDRNEQPFPPLAISDLLILTLCVAFTLAPIAKNYQEALQRGDITAWQAMPDLFDYLAIGTALFGLIVLVRQRIRHEAVPLSPGHWVLVAVGPYSVCALGSLLIRPLILAYVSNGRPGTHATDNLFFVAIIGCSIVLSLPAMRALEWRWRACIGLIYAWLTAMAFWLMLDAANVLGYWPMSSPWRQHLIAISTTFEILAAVAAVVALAVDTAKRVRRDWLHYFGIASIVLGSIEVAFTWGRFSVRFWRDLFLHLLP
ncbi:MAG TPA: hypothetical protein VGI40_25265 [Pirellulaceae bacterium]|jgi:hypothetical protein